MAEIAFGGNCSACGTLVACAGSYSDERLVGMCPVCQVPVTMQNHAYVAPASAGVIQLEPGTYEVSDTIDLSGTGPIDLPEPVDNPLVDDEQQRESE